MNIYPFFYFPPIQWFAICQQETEILVEVYAHYRKQLYTNRMRIKGPNGCLNLSIPIQRRGARMPIRDKKISYAENWQKQHWGAIISAYRNSPYFEYYEDQFRVFFESKPIFLLDLNHAVLDCLFQLLQWEKSIHFTTEYQEPAFYQSDFRQDFDPSGQLLPDWFNVVSYPQVFEGFAPGLSLIDLLCNEGPNSRLILQTSIKKPKA